MRSLESVTITSTDGRSRLVLAGLPGTDTLVVALELEGLGATLFADRHELDSLSGLVAPSGEASVPGLEWHSFGGEVTLRVTGSGLEVELCHSLKPTWRANGVIAIGPKQLAERATELARLLASPTAT